MRSLFSHLECAHCGSIYSKFSLNTYCKKLNCNSPLLAKYLTDIKLSKSAMTNRLKNMWRYREMLPVLHTKNLISLGEGMTPLLKMNHLGKYLGLKNLYLKDEGLNPTGSFKARGLSAAISKAMELGVKACAIPTAGNAGSALSAYCAAAAMAAVVFMPSASRTK